MTADQVREMVREIIQRAPMSVDSLAEAAGVTRHTLYAWAAGRRNPTPENLARLTEALDRRSEDLQEMAGRLRDAAG